MVWRLSSHIQTLHGCGHRTDRHPPFGPRGRSGEHTRLEPWKNVHFGAPGVGWMKGSDAVPQWPPNANVSGTLHRLTPLNAHPKPAPGTLETNPQALPSKLPLEKRSTFRAGDTKRRGNVLPRRSSVPLSAKKDQGAMAA